MISVIVEKLKSVIPKKIRLFIFRQTLHPKIGGAKWYHLLSVKPISSNWGEERGTPVDRYYIEKFLSENSALIKGRVLEIADNYYTLKYGDDKVLQSEILHASAGNPKATYTGDLTDVPEIASSIFDCIILTQTLQLIPDLESAVNTLYRILKTGGNLLVTVPGISKIYVDAENRWSDYWRFTENSLRLVFGKKFERKNIEVKSYGNVFTSVAFLHGLAAEELETAALDYKDNDYQMLVCLSAVK